MKFIALKTNVKKIVLTAIGLIGGGYAIYKSINKVQFTRDYTG